MQTMTEEQFNELEQLAVRAQQSKPGVDVPSLKHAQTMRIFHLYANPDAILYLLAERRELLRKVEALHEHMAHAEQLADQVRETLNSIPNMTISIPRR